MKRTFLTLFTTMFLLTFCWHSPARAQVDSTIPKVEIPNTQLLKLTSSVVNQEYQLYINLPGSYGKDTGKIYPVVYLLDGQYDFPFVTGVYGGQYYDGFIPEFITVGITWGGKNPDAGSLRARDFTPTQIKQMPQTGGGPKFLAFIKQELIPFIRTKYRVSDDRTLMGSSLGGLFTLYALFNEPSLFHRYVLTSPSIGWDNSVLRGSETKFEASASPKPIRLFMGMGELEGDPSQFQQLEARLKKVKGLELQTTIIKNTGHAGTKPEGFARGLQYVFERPDIDVPAATLNSYLGTYLVGTDSIRLVNEKGKLVAITPGNEKINFSAETANDFYLKGAFLSMHFKKDDAGKISGFRLVQFDGEIFVKKVD